MSKKVLIRKQVGSGNILYTRDVGRGQGGGFMEDLAALRGGARGLNAQGRQSFIPGAQLGDAKPTGMQRLAAGANIAGRGLAAALTGLQTAYGLQGGNVGALGNIADTYAANVPGLTANRPTEAQQAQNMATEVFNQQQQQMANDAMMQQVNPAPANQSGPIGNQLPGQTQGTPLGQLSPPAGLSTPIVPPADPMQQTLQIEQPAAQPAQVSPELVEATQGAVGGMYSPQIQPYQGNTNLTNTANLIRVNRPVLTPATPPVASGADNVAPTVPLPTVSERRIGLSPTANTGGADVSAVQQEGFNFVTGEQGNFNTAVPHYQQLGEVDFTPPVGGRINVGNSPFTTGPNGEIIDKKTGQVVSSSSIKNAAFAMQVLNEFGDMLHKADPHVAGAVVMRVFLEKMLRK